MSQVKTDDGTIYLHTHKLDSSEEIVKALTPYVGRIMRCDLPNNYGHYHSYQGRLVKASGSKVTLEVLVRGKIHTAEVEAFDAFGTNCAVIEPDEGVTRCSRCRKLRLPGERMVADPCCGAPDCEGLMNRSHYTCLPAALQRIETGF